MKPRTARQKYVSFLVALLGLLGLNHPARALGLGEVTEVGAAFLTHFAIHESGHYIMGRMGGAQEIAMNFLTTREGNIYLGLSTAKGLPAKNSLPYKLAGEVAGSYAFETALNSHRNRPTTFNRSLLFFSGTDFLFYSIYAFYLSENRNPSYDPVGIAQETGLSDEMILGVAMLQTALNAWRVYSNQDRFVPYLSITEDWAEFGVQFTP